MRAERERVPQAGALPDPVLSLGIQNDGFSEIMIGKMETSFYQVMLSQGAALARASAGCAPTWPASRADEAGAALARARLRDGGGRPARVHRPPLRARSARPR